MSVAPSPNCHSYELIVPSLSVDVDVNEQSWLVHECVNAAVGGTLGATTTTDSKWVPVAPALSVTVSVAL